MCLYIYKKNLYLRFQLDKTSINPTQSTTVWICHRHFLRTVWMLFSWLLINCKHIGFIGEKSLRMWEAVWKYGRLKFDCTTIGSKFEIITFIIDIFNVCRIWRFVSTSGFHGRICMACVILKVFQLLRL